MTIFNIPESESPNSLLENWKRHLKIIQKILGVNKIRKSEFNSLYRIEEVIRDKCRPIIIKLNGLNAKLRNLQVISKGNKNAVYSNPDRTASELVAFKEFRE